MTISNPKELLKNMQPELINGKFYFASVDQSHLMAVANYFQYIEGVFREKEGITIVFTEELIDIVKPLSRFDLSGPFALITLTVNSDLFAVGFLAKITEALATNGISVNAYSAYHHDHIFVPYDRKDDVIEILNQLQTDR